MAGGQLTFEGMTVDESKAGLGNAGDLAIKDQYELGDIVSGTWVGRVVKVQGHQKGEDSVVRKHIINVTDFTIGKEE